MAKRGLCCQANADVAPMQAARLLQDRAVLRQLQREPGAALFRAGNNAALRIGPIIQLFVFGRACDKNSIQQTAGPGVAYSGSTPESDTRNDAPGAVGHLDFLDLPLGGESPMAREAKEFCFERAWSIAYFGQHRLKRGWWLFESEGDAGLSGIELRLTSALNPLITLANNHNGVRNAGIRIYLPAAETFDVSILLSPWPGRVRLNGLRLRRLGMAETAVMFASNAKRIFTTRDALRKLAHLGLQFLRGRPLGFRLAPTPTTKSPASVISASETVKAPALSCRVVRHDVFDGFISDADSLDPRAVDIISYEFAQLPEVQAIYCDVREGDSIIPRPCRDPELGRWFEVATPPVFFRRDASDDSHDPQRRLDDVLKRYGSCAVARLPLPLVRRTYGVRPSLPPAPAPTLSRQPRVSVIVPTKYRTDLLEKCLQGLARRTDYPDLEVVLVDNGSTDGRLADVLEEARRSFEVIHVRDMGGFNFSRLVNLGVRVSRGEIVLLLNDDVEPAQTCWLNRMIESAMLPDVGAVGARLLFPDRTIQHAGVVMGIGGVCGHLWKGASEESAARNPYVVYPGERMAVTGACLAINRELFDRVGGFDETLPVSLNDIDFCLRVRALGQRNIYRGDAVLIHHESQSRGQDSETAQRRRRAAKETAIFLSRWRKLIRDDPFGSPAFDRRTESGAVHQSVLADVS